MEKATPQPVHLWGAACLHLNRYLCKVSHAVYGVFRTTGLQVQPAPVKVHLDSSEEAWESFGDAHGGRQINLDCKAESGNSMKSMEMDAAGPGW